MSFTNRRTELAAYRTLFLYNPIVATIDNTLFKMVDEYVKIYDQLANRLKNIYPRAAEQLHDTIELATAQFLALDVVIIDRQKNEAALLTTLHPLHLWKWVELAHRLKNNAETFNQTEQTTIIRSVKNIPTILNTLLLHSKMFQPPRHLEETRLVLAGEIRNPATEGTVGIPYYEPIARQSSTTDGLDKLGSLIRNFLASIRRSPGTNNDIDRSTNPPSHSEIFSCLRVDSDSSSSILHGARITVYRTDPQVPVFDLLDPADEEVLELFRQNPLWTFHIDLTHTGSTQICSHIRERAPYHITLLCDPSAAVVQPLLHVSQEQPSPFVIPLQVAYDPFSRTPFNLSNHQQMEFSMHISMCATSLQVD